MYMCMCVPHIIPCDECVYTCKDCGCVGDFFAVFCFLSLLAVCVDGMKDLYMLCAS